MNSKTYKINYKGDDLEIATNYRSNGKELIFLLHGLGCAKESFNDIFKFPQFKEFSLLIPDLVGFGDSSKPQDFSYSLEDHAEICKMLLDEIKPEKIHIVAHSMGGGVGVLLAEKVQDKLASFSNIEGNLIAKDGGLISRKTISVSFDEFRNTLFDKIKTDIKKFNDIESMLWTEWLKKSDPLAFYRTAESMVKRSDSNELLRKFTAINANKYYFYGDKNATMKILKKLGNIKKIPISNSGHFVMNDNPGEFYETLAGLIDKKCTNLRGKICDCKN